MKTRVRLLMSYMLYVSLLFGLGMPAYAVADTTAPVVKDVYITNPKDSYSEGDVIYFNIQLDEDSNLEYANLSFELEGGNAEIDSFDTSYDSATKIVTIEFVIDDSVSSGTWKFDELIVMDCYGNFVLYYSFERDTPTFLKDLSFEVVGNVTDTSAPIVKDIYITNPKDSYTEGDQVYINIVFEEDSDLDFACIEFKNDENSTLLKGFAYSYDLETKTASFKFVIDDSVSSGTWKFNYISARDYYGNFILQHSYDYDIGILKDFSFKVDNTKENNTPSSPDDFLTYDWTGCVGSSPTISITSSTNELYTMVVLPGSISSDVTITHTGSSSIIIGSWGQYTEGYELKFSVPGVYKLKFIQNVTKETLYYYANITDHEINSYTEHDGLKIGTCKQCNEKVEQFGAPSWRVENKKLVGTEYTTGQVMIALYGENGRLIKVKFCEKGEAKTIGGTTVYRYLAPIFSKDDLAQSKQILCFNFTEQSSPIRNAIKFF